MQSFFARISAWRFFSARTLFSLIFTLAAFAPRSSASAQTNPTTAPDGVADLAALVHEGIQHNPAVVAARDHWEALEHVPLRQRTLPDPQVQLQEFTVGSPRPAAGYETSDFYYTGVGITQDLPGPGKLRLQGAIAEQDAAIARHQFEAAQRAAAEQIRESYYELYYLTRTIALLEAERSDLGRIEQIAEARYRFGEGQAQDVLQAQLQATQMLNQIEHHHREMQQRQLDLKAALGRDLDTPNLTIGAVQPTTLDLTPTALRQAVADHAPDLMVDRAAVARGENALSLARKGYLPDFSIGYTYEKTGPGFRDYYMLTVGAKIPLYFWRRQTPAIAEAALELAAARAQIRGHQLDTGAAAADQLVAIHASERILKIYQQGLIPQAETSQQAALAAYRVSKVDFQTLISAFVALLELRDEYYREVANHEIAVAKLEQIIGEVK